MDKQKQKKAVYEDLEYGLHTLEIVRVSGYISLHGADYRVDDAQVRKNISTWGNAGILAYQYANTLNNDIFKQSMEELNPDVVVLVIGTNDNGQGHTVDSFQKSLTTMVRNVQDSVPNAEVWVISTFETTNSSDGLQSYWDIGFPTVVENEYVHYWTMGEWFGPYSTDYMQDSWHCDSASGRKMAEKMHEIILEGEDVVGVNIVSAEENAKVEARTGTAFEDLALPKRVAVTLDDLQNSVVTVNVEWSSEGYRKNVAGTYTLTGTIKDDEEMRIYNPDEITATVQVEVSHQYAAGKEPGLKLYYDFGEINGTTVPDLTGNYDGTVSGNVAIVDGVDGSAVYFPQDTNAYVDIPVEAFDSRDITISAWMKLEQISTWLTMLGVGSDTTNYFQLVASGSPSTGACGLSAALKETKGKEYRVSAAASDTLPLNEWAMVTYTQEGRIGKLYLDGELVATSEAIRRTFKDLVSAANSTAHLGAPQVWSDPATKGAIDEFKIYDYAMTAEEVEDALQIVNKDALEITINNAVDEADQDKYEAAAWPAYEEAFSNAQDVLADESVTQEEINAAQNELIDAIEALVMIELPSLPYVDVVETEWYYDAVYYNYLAGIMTGKTTELFAPGEDLARGQFASILHRMEKEPEVAFTPEFPDVEEKAWYAEAILWAKRAGVVSGYKNGNFGPGDPITREQMAVMMYNYAEYKGYDVTATDDLKAFGDAGDVTEYALESVKWAVGAGIISGKSNGTVLEPLGKTSRAECAAIIMNFMNKCVE